VIGQSSQRTKVQEALAAKISLNAFGKIGGGQGIITIKLCWLRADNQKDVVELWPAASCLRTVFASPRQCRPNKKAKNKNF
jgi:hypothetical protein